MPMAANILIEGPREGVVALWRQCETAISQRDGNIVSPVEWSGNEKGFCMIETEVEFDDQAQHKGFVDEMLGKVLDIEVGEVEMHGRQYTNHLIGGPFFSVNLRKPNLQLPGGAIVMSDSKPIRPSSQLVGRIAMTPPEMRAATPIKGSDLGIVRALSNLVEGMPGRGRDVAIKVANFFRLRL